MVVLLATDGYDVARSAEWLRVLLTYTTVIALFSLLALLTAGSTWASFATTFVVFALLVLLGFARFETAGSFDYGFFHENVGELVTPLGRHIVGSQVRKHEVVLLLVLPLAIAAYVLFRCRRWRPPEPLTRRQRIARIAACVLVLLAPVLMRVSTHETLTSFVIAGARFHLDERRAEASTISEPYPFVRTFTPSKEAAAMAAGAPRPHVILLFLESWSGLYVNHTRSDGERATPVFDRERLDGLTFEHFYGNSIQSSRGRFATMCSLVPLYRGKEFRDLEQARLRCLPRLLADSGYRTFIYSASDEPMFERSTPFFAQLGFDEVRFEDPAARGVDPAVWGAGLQDDVYYRRFFAAVDERIESAPDTPIFAAAINASNHYPFRHDPNHRAVEGYPTRYRRDYLASLGAQDARLRVFFDEIDRRPALQNAIIVLVGDHSFPADEHGIHFNGLGAYEESFKTVLLLRWRGRVPPRLDRDRTASQLDIAPTIVDLLQLAVPTHFVGRSLIASDEPGDPRSVAPMVQPYDGIRLVAVRWPFKLEHHESAAQEHLYDLSVDPEENDDRIGDPALEAKRAELAEGISRIRRSQAILSANRVWPPQAP